MPSQQQGRTIVYCIVPSELANKLHDPLRRHFADQPDVEVVVERRGRDRRRREDRRGDAKAVTAERRRIRNMGGRRAGQRRAALVIVDAPSLPRRLGHYAARLVFVERLEPTTERLEDLDTARVVARFQAGERAAFTELYLRYFDRVYGYLRVALRDPHGAEDLTQQVFLKVFENLPRYERRDKPFKAWLMVIVRNQAIDALRRSRRIDIEDAEDIDRRRDIAEEPEGFGELSWISDRELLLFIERLPAAQQQVLLLRYMFDLSTADIACILDRTHNDVSALHSRAVRFLRARLTAIGRGTPSRQRARVSRWPQQALVLRRRRFALLSR